MHLFVFVCVYVCVCVRAHVCICVCTHMCVCVRAHVCLCGCTCVCTHVCVCIHVCTHVCVCTHLCICVLCVHVMHVLCVSVSVCAPMYLCVIIKFQCSHNPHYKYRTRTKFRGINFRALTGSEFRWSIFSCGVIFVDTRCSRSEIVFQLHSYTRHVKFIRISTKMKFFIVAIGIPCIMDVWEGHREPSQTEQFFYYLVLPV